MLYTKTVEKGTLDLIKQLAADEKLNDFTLVGGTALALQIGHRKSVDIDLFSTKPFDSTEIADHLRNNYRTTGITSERGKYTVAGYINGVRTTLITHQYRDFNPPITRDGVRMASLEDIGALKIHAIHNDGSRYKDFLDIYHLLEKMPLNRMLEAYQVKYPDMSPEVAKIALGHHDDVKTYSQIEQFGNPVHFPDIVGRINHSIGEPDKIFRSRHRNRVEGEPHQRIRKRRDR